jgi:hypothetical protein
LLDNHDSKDLIAWFIWRFSRVDKMLEIIDSWNKESNGRCQLYETRRRDFMSTEIKIEQNPIKQAVTTLESSAQNFQSSFPDEIKGENHLDLLDQLNELNRAYSSLMESYQLLLLQHVKTTEGSVGSLMETDQKLGDYIGFLK